MLNYRQKKNLAVLDLVITIIAFLGVIVTTAIVIIVQNEMRNVFIGELIVLVVVFANGTKRIGKFLKEKKALKKEYSAVTIARKSFI